MWLLGLDLVNCSSFSVVTDEGERESHAEDEADECRNRGDTPNEACVVQEDCKHDAHNQSDDSPDQLEADHAGHLAYAPEGVHPGVEPVGVALGSFFHGRTECSLDASVVGGVLVGVNEDASPSQPSILVVRCGVECIPKTTRY